MRKLLRLAAETDSTWTRDAGHLQGRCLICNGKLSFDERTGIGANLEHIVPRSRGGTNDAANLALTHPACNSEKGRNWYSRNGRGRHAPEKYDELLRRLIARRRARWRDPEPDVLSGARR